MTIVIAQDSKILPEIRRLYAEKFLVYGAHKVWRQLGREGQDAARCTAELLMRRFRLLGVVPWRKHRTTIPDDRAERLLHRINRQFQASRPNQLSVADVTNVATWTSFVYVAFVIDVFARRIIGWLLASSMRTDLILDALEQALWARSRTHGVIYHSNHGRQYLSIRNTERLAEAGVEPTVGSVGNSYDNALVETIIGLYKTEVIYPRGPWRHFDAVECAHGMGRLAQSPPLLEPIGIVPPAQLELVYYRQQAEVALAA